MRVIRFFSIGLALFFSLAPLILLGQKLEVEKRIKKEAFPEKAIQYLCNNFDINKKVRWYREFSKNITSYEAKFKLNKKRHSVEFFENGELMDVEIEMPYKLIPEATRQKMERRWADDFKKSRVKRVQKQESPSGQRFEIIVRGKTEDHIDLYEYLFEKDGEYVQSLLIVDRPSDLNLY